MGHSQQAQQPRAPPQAAVPGRTLALSPARPQGAKGGRAGDNSAAPRVPDAVCATAPRLPIAVASGPLL
eukprot:11226874-Lingulodinium_polyedra.AAC.1